MFNPEGFAEALQDAITAGNPIGLNSNPSAGTVNFTLNQILDIDNLSSLLGGEIICTMYEEGSTIIRSSRMIQQERSVRFLMKAQSGHESINLGWRLLKWLENEKRLATASFTTWVARFDKTPSIIGVDQGGTALSDFVATFFVWNYPG